MEAALKFKKLGNQCFSKSEFKKAIQHYTRCIKECAVITVQSFKMKDAVISPAVHTEAIKTQADALSNRAACHIMLLNASAALNDCSEALELFPGHQRAQVRYATCKLYLCNFEEAANLLKECKSTISQKALHDDVLSKLENIGEIVTVIEKCKVPKQNYIDAEKNLERIEKHLQYLPKSMDLICAKCSCLFQMYRYKDALEYLSDVPHPLMPVNSESYPVIMSLKAQAQIGLGHIEKGLELADGCCDLILDKSSPLHMKVSSQIKTWKEMIELRSKAKDLYNTNPKESNELYAQAIQISMSYSTWKSSSFTAILFCNRSATLQK